ncbi:MAG: hypothetical protein AAB589_01175 [Patescibacteria group bacterium]
MNNLEKYLAKFKVLEPADRQQKEAVAEAIFRLAGIELTPKQIKFTGRKVFLTLTPIERSAVFIKKEKILTLLRDLLDRQAPTDLF